MTIFFNQVRQLGCKLLSKFCPQMLNLAPFKKNIDSLVAALTGFLIIFLFTRHGGIGLCPDGVVYKTTAESVCQNGKLSDFTHSSMINFPALYPLFLAGIMFLTRLKPLLFAPYLNSILFAAVIYISGYIMENFNYYSKWYKRSVLTCIVLSPALLEVYSMVWSETIFIFLLLLFLMLMYRYFKSYSRSVLIGAAVIAALASVTRYAGVTIMVAGLIFILLDTKLFKNQKIKHAILYISISPLLLIINLVRNYIVSGTDTGMRERSLVTFKDNIHDAGVVFNGWLPFVNGHTNAAISTTFVLIIFLVILSVKYFINNRRLASYESMAAVFSLLYIVFMIVIASISRFETLDSRFFSPVYILLIWSCSSWIISMTKRVGKPIKKWVAIFSIMIFLSFQYGQLNADYETWDGVKDAGIPGYTEDQWRYSQTVQFIEEDSLLFRSGYTVYSNAYDAVYFFTHRSGKFLPHKENKTEVQNFLNDRHCYAVWFTDGEDSDLVSMNFLTNEKKMKLLRQFNDGAVYEYK